jgi:hypothetical protein
LGGVEQELETREAATSARLPCRLWLGQDYPEVWDNYNTLRSLWRDPLNRVRPL